MFSALNYILDAENVTLPKNEGDCYARLENPPAAIQCYSLAYGLNKENAALGNVLVNSMLSANGDFTGKALAVCDTALYYNPCNRALEQSKGMALYMNKKYAEADTLYSLLMAKGDSSYLTLKYGGISRYYAGQYFRTIEPLAAAYEKDTASAEICVMLAAAFSKMHDIKQAYVFLDKAEENMKPSPFLLNQLTLSKVEIYQKDRRYNEAANFYYTVWKSNPKRMDLVRHIATIYSANNQSEYENDAMRQRGLFAYTLYAVEFLKTGENPLHISYTRRLLESFYEDAFFRNLTQLPLLSPEGEKEVISMEELGNIIKQIPQ
ncbi:MAG: hypothetical protein LBJ60_05015 [Tannerellaceae bacterium]|nr:hypothetical protein [Tannerellaceae bacterium]